MPFGRNAVIRLEHGGTNESTEHYETVTYWYGLPGASLRAHRRTARSAIPPANARIATLARRIAALRNHLALRVGAGHAQGRRDLSRPHRSRPHHQTTSSKFTLKIDPNNLGVMLRRKLDYQFPNQRAECSSSGGAMASPPASGTSPAPTPASFPARAANSAPRLARGADLQPPLPRRRISASPGRSPKAAPSIRVRVKFTPVDIPLYPGHPPAETAWSEMRYTAYSFVMPR